MCLYVLKGYKTPRKATEDIVVYKRLMKSSWPNEFYSPYQSFRYVRGKTYTSKIDPVLTQFRRYPKRRHDGTIVIGEINIGIHAYSKKEEAYFRKGQWDKVIKCIIPKGSKYHLGEGNEIVTNTLIIPEIKRNVSI